MATIKVDNWDVVKRRSGYWLMTPSGLDGPYKTAEEARDARTVEWDDIRGKSEPDEYSEAPWDNCDGWEHEFHRCHGNGGIKDSQGWVRGHHGPGYIEVTDETVLAWGVGYPGCSKQVRAEAIAAKKREALEQLVRWYVDGWEVYVAVAIYGDYTDSVCGIFDDTGEYTDGIIEECRHGVADQLEKDGHIVAGRPDPPKPYNRVDAFRDRIKRNMTDA